MATTINVQQSPQAGAREKRSQMYVDLVSNMLQQRNTANTERRAQETFEMEQANWKYQRDLQTKTDNQKKAFSTWQNKGWDTAMRSLDNPNFNQVYNTKAPNFNDAYSGYEKEMSSYDQEAEYGTFKDKWDERNQAFVKKQGNKMELHWQAFKRGNPGVNDADLMREFQNKYGANQVYNNYVLTFGQQSATENFSYMPQADEEGWGSYLNPFSDPAIKDPFTGQQLAPASTNTGAVATAGAGTTLAGTALTGGYRQMGRTTEVLGDIAKDWKKGAMSAKKFLETYGMTKTQAGGNPNLKGSVFTKSDDILKYARGASFAGGNLMRFGHSALPTLGSMHAGSMVGGGIGGLVGGDTGEVVGNVAGGITGPMIMKWAMTDAGKKTLKQYAPKALAKLAGSMAGYMGPQAAEPISTALGAAGTAWAVYDIMQLVKAMPELARMIKGS